MIPRQARTPLFCSTREMHSCYKTFIEQRSNLEFLIQVLSDILVDRINDRVMASVYSEIKGPWIIKQKIKEQVGFNFMW